MQTIDEIEKEILEQLDAKPMLCDIDNWYLCLSILDKNSYVPLQYKPGFLKYQEKYFRDVYSDYKDISMVLYRGRLSEN